MLKELELMKEIIDKKYKELSYDKRDKSNIFWKITEFEANAIGQIGEEFVKEIFRKFNLKFDETKKNFHDEYDIKLQDGTKIEIKTARKGKNNDTFQFNGINPNYTPDFIIFIGILENNVLYRILNKKDKIEYKHEGRKWMVDLETTEKQLVKMNPGNQVNYKLTLNKKELKNISDLEDEIKFNILKKRPFKPKL